MSKLMQNRSFHELKKQASFFIKEKIKTARLVVTDVTPEELLTEELTDSAHLSIDSSSMAVITKASFEVDQFQRIVNVLRQRMVISDKREWRGMYNTLTMLNHLLLNGPLSIFNEFQHERILIEDVLKIKWIDEKGLDCSLKVRNLAEKVLRLLEDKMVLKRERERNRELRIGRVITGRDNLLLDDHGTCEDNHIGEDDHDHDHPFIENDEDKTTQLLLSSSI